MVIIISKYISYYNRGKSHNSDPYIIIYNKLFTIQYIYLKFYN